MPTTTAYTQWIPDVNLAARLQNFISGLSNPAELDPTRELQQIAEDRSLDIGRALGAFAKQFLDDESSQPETITEFLEQWSRFITQDIADHSRKISDLEQRIINGFRSHAALSLATPRSFRPGASRMTANTLESLLELTDELNATRTLLVQENTTLKKDFVDSDDSIILAHDRLHTIGNAFARISMSAQILGRLLNSRKQDEKQTSEYLTALQTSISTMICALLATDASSVTDDPIERFSKMHPNVEVTMEGGTPKYLYDEHSLLIENFLGHLTRNAYEAGATEVSVKAEYQPSDSTLVIGVMDNAPGGMPDGLPEKLKNGEAGSGWKILTGVTFKRLGVNEVKIISPHQTTPEPHGTLVMISIPVQAKTGNEPDNGSIRKADSGPLPARKSIQTPSHALPIPKPTSLAVGLDPNLAGGATCFSEEPMGILLEFKNLP